MNPTQQTTEERMRAVLQRFIFEASPLFSLAADSIVNGEDGWHCKACGMELDSGGGHREDCLASRILDLGGVLYAAEDVLHK
jgi:hypothetical protein